MSSIAIVILYSISNFLDAVFASSSYYFSNFNWLYFNFDSVSFNLSKNPATFWVKLSLFLVKNDVILSTKPWSYLSCSSFVRILSVLWWFSGSLVVSSYSGLLSTISKRTPLTAVASSSSKSVYSSYTSILDSSGYAFTGLIFAKRGYSVTPGLWFRPLITSGELGKLWI